MWSHVPQTQLQLSTHYVVTCTADTAPPEHALCGRMYRRLSQPEHALCGHMYRRLSFS
ncbi:hypothetical protein DPMN_064765 [Dreissena polymorpha]|uniref:Uncharacterized protein n=1 Tax=Dreissena polymorpha TaxID=45954 RepID=A0A9D4HKE5_DREPO|nr:hypothetical protein DPMN_064765 [Dreissena polymorpha]